MKAKKITFILGGLSKGGAERVVCNLANYLVNHNYDIDIITLLSSKIEYEINSNINIIDISATNREDAKMVTKWIKYLHKYFKEDSERIIVSFFIKINIVVLLSLLGCKNKVIVSERSDPFNDGRSRLYNFLTNILYRKSNYIVFQTNRISSLYSSFGKKRRVIPNPVNFYEEFENYYPKQNLIVSVGRLDGAKNHEMLIKAIGNIRKEMGSYKVIIYGDGPNRMNLECLVEELGLGDIVELPGIVSNVHEHIYKAKLFVLTSNIEGLSNALQEAMSLGLCCISTDCLGSDELIENTENGIIIKREDRVALEQQILNLIHNDILLEKYGKNAWKKSRDYAIEQIAELWQNIL